MKLCKDCKHHIPYKTDNPVKQPSSISAFDICNRKTITIDRVTGDLIENYEFCNSERYTIFPFNYLMGDCGSNARYFEAK